MLPFQSFVQTMWDTIFSEEPLMTWIYAQTLNHLEVCTC